MLIHKSLKSVYLVLLSMVLLVASGCQTIDTTNNWPSDLPDRQLFVDTHNESIAAGEKTIKLESHLVWIKQFYRGTVLYPQGWNKISKLVLESLNSQTEMDNLKPRLYDLGLAISREWAKDNSVRKISSANMLVWVGGLRTSTKEGTQVSFISQVEQDVEALINGDLSSSDIKSARYHEPEDFDDF